MTLPKRIENSRYDLGNGISANDRQREAIDDMIIFLHSKDEEYLLIGRGGTGKSTIIKKIIEIFRKEFSKPNWNSVFGDDIVCATISHAAKNVLQNFVGRSSTVITVAKLLGMKQNITEEGELEFVPDEYQRRFPLPIEEASLLIIDECSMISKNLLELIKKKKQPNTKIIWMGDNVQLPPIDKDRQPNEDSPTFKVEKFSKLIERIRQGEESPILPVSDLYAENIEAFNKTGKIPYSNPLLKKFRVTNYNKETNKGVIFEKDISRLFRMILKDLKSEKGKVNPSYVKAISYRNKNMYGKAPYSIKSLNLTIRKYLWSSPKDMYVEGEYVIANDTYMPGQAIVFHNSDSMIVTKVSRGNYMGIDVYKLTMKDSYGYRHYDIPVVSEEGEGKYKNYLKKIANEARNNHRMWKKYYDYRSQFANIGYGYAINSHKAQGSTYENVYIFEDDIFSVSPTTPKEKNQSMYVACTRASHRLVIFSKNN